MNFPWLRNSLLGLSLLLGFGSEAPAQLFYGIPTAYVLPTSYYPTAYIYPSAAYVSPTSYVYPTSYAATSYDLTPTSYLVPAVSYRRSLLFPWRYVARPTYATALAYTPTAYYTPTVYSPTVYSPTVYSPTVYSPTVYTTSYSTTVLDYPVVTSSTVYCPEGTTVAAAPARQPQRAPARPENDERAPTSAAETVPSNVPPYESPNPNQPPGGYIPRTGSGVPPAPRPEPGTESPPAVPPYEVPPEPKPGAAGAPTKEVNTALPPPAAIPPLDSATTPVRREVKKPVALTPGGSAGRVANILEGKVVSSDTRQAEEGVRITVASRAGTFENRIAMTDAYGRYAVRLPDGDWTVNVEMPSGRVYPVSQITISGGQIVDNFGRTIPSLTITR